MAPLRSRHLSLQHRGRRHRRQPCAPGPERPHDHAVAQPAHLEQRVLVPVGDRPRAVPHHRQRHHAQPDRLVRARLQSRLLQSRPGLGRHPDVRAEQRQRRGLQLGHARRRWPVSLGRPEHDGHRQGRLERQPVLRQRFQPCADQRDRGHVQPQPFRRQPCRGELARRLGRLQLRIAVPGQHLREQHRGDGHRARAGQRHRRQHVHERRDRASASGGIRHRIPTGAIRSTATRTAGTTCSPATPSPA